MKMIFMIVYCHDVSDNDNNDYYKFEFDAIDTPAHSYDDDEEDKEHNIFDVLITFYDRDADSVSVFRNVDGASVATNLHVLSSSAPYEMENPISLNQSRMQHVTRLASK